MPAVVQDLSFSGSTMRQVVEEGVSWVASISGAMISRAERVAFLEKAVEVAVVLSWTRWSLRRDLESRAEAMEAFDLIIFTRESVEEDSESHLREVGEKEKEVMERAGGMSVCAVTFGSSVASAALKMSHGSVVDITFKRCGGRPRNGEEWFGSGAVFVKDGGYHDGAAKGDALVEGVTISGGPESMSWGCANEFSVDGDEIGGERLDGDVQWGWILLVGLREDLIGTEGMKEGVILVNNTL